MPSRKTVSTHRVQLELGPRSMERLNALKTLTESTSYAEVMRKALAVYSEVTTDLAAGCEMMIRYPDGSILPYKMLLP